MKKLLSLVLIISVPQFVYAWGGRGHDTICQAAVHLVKNKKLLDFLRLKTNVMAGLCNIPDVDWKNLDFNLTQIGDPTHHINPEVIGLAANDVPTDIDQIIQKYSNSESVNDQKKIVAIPKELGTVWWRADQMVRRGIENGKKIAGAEIPSNSKQEQDNSLLYNQSVFEMMVSMGILGHFVGDTAMPFHSTTDYDGWAANQGGIHFYYETASVGQFGPDLINRVVQKAKKLKNTKFLNAKSPVEKMRALSVVTLGDLKSILKVDPIIKNSQLKIEKGMSLKTPAERLSPEIGAKKFEKLIIEEMARAALLLAAFWDQIFVESGAPNLTPYRSYRHPYRVDFIMPDYYDTKTNQKD